MIISHIQLVSYTIKRCHITGQTTFCTPEICMAGSTCWDRLVLFFFYPGVFKSPPIIFRPHASLLFLLNLPPPPTFQQKKSCKMEWNLKVSHSFEYFQHLQKCGNCTKLVGGFTYFFFSPRKLGKMNPIWLIFLKMGWFNHQLANLHFLTFFCGEKHRCLRIHPPLKRWRWEVMMWPTQHFSDPWEIPYWRFLRRMISVTRVLWNIFFLTQHHQFSVLCCFLYWGVCEQNVGTMMFHDFPVWFADWWLQAVSKKFDHIPSSKTNISIHNPWKLMVGSDFRWFISFWTWPPFFRGV